MSLNKWILSGQVTSEVKEKNYGTLKACEFEFTSRGMIGDKENVTVVRVIAKGALAEKCIARLRVGKALDIEGSVRHEHQVLAGSGKKIYWTELHAYEITNPEKDFHA